MHSLSFGWIKGGKKKQETSSPFPLSFSGVNEGEEEKGRHDVHIKGIEPTDPFQARKGESN